MGLLRSRHMDTLAETTLRVELCTVAARDGRAGPDVAHALGPPPPSGPPVVQPVEGPGGRYRLVETFVPDLPVAVTRAVPLWVPADASAAVAFFNGASVPWLAWWFLRPMEPRVVAGALVHDMLYVQRGELCGGGGRVVVSRTFSDLAFFVLMVRSRLEPFRAWVAYVAVRTFSRSLFLRGAPPPTPCAAGRRAEVFLARAAWALLIDRTHRGSWARLVGILVAFVGVGGATAWSTWAARAGASPTATALSLTVAAALVLTALWVVVGSVWCVQHLARLASGVPPADGGR